MIILIAAPPHITLEPTQQVVRPGVDAFITCSATGDEPISIEWSAVDRRLPPSSYYHDGVLNFRSISTEDAGRYLCRARNSVGEAEAIAEVIVIGKYFGSVIFIFGKPLRGIMGSLCYQS